MAFWSLLLPHGLAGDALTHITPSDGEEDVRMDEEGWQNEYIQWWFDFLNQKGGKGVSKDTWVMVRLYVLPHSHYGVLPRSLAASLAF